MKGQSQQPPNANPANRGYAAKQPDPAGVTSTQQPMGDPNAWVSGGFGSNQPQAQQQQVPAAQGQYLGDLNGQPTYSNSPAAQATAYGSTKPMQVDPTAPMNTDPRQYGPTVSSVNTSNVPGLVGGDALGGAMHDAQDAAYKNAAGYLDPQWQNQQAAMESKLANQGVTQNSEAWNKAMDDFGRQKEFAYSQARSGAVQQGNAAQSQLFNQGLASHGTLFGEAMEGGKFTNAVQQQLAAQGFTQQQITNLEAQHRFDNSMTSRNQDINELLLKQKNPLDMYNSLTNGSNVSQPQFTNTPGANTANTDLMAAIQQAYGGQLNAYNAQVGSANSSNSGMAAIIAALICDRRLKKNIRKIGMHRVGVPLYAFDYLWDEPGIGVMADELAEVMPEAVHTLDCGYRYVDYARI